MGHALAAVSLIMTMIRGGGVLLFGTPAGGEGMKSHIVKHSIVIAGHKTSDLAGVFIPAN
jgi:hypothetical protein